MTGRTNHLISGREDADGHLIADSHLVMVSGRVIVDTSVCELLADASGERVRLRTTAPAQATTC